MKRKTTKDFIKQAKKIHGSKYDYSLVDYINNYTKIKIICSKHGVFKQRPDKHLLGQKCTLCSNKKQKTTKNFIKQAKKIHKNKYNYSLVEYKNNRTKIKIICPEHGVFEQLPSNHLQKQGCYFCGRINIKIKQRTNLNNFIEKAKKIHKNKYNYSLVEYKNNRTKIKIICPVHGVFEQNPYSHLQGKQCKKCANINRRLKRISEIERDKFNDNQMIPSYNPKACEIFDEISEKNNIHIQHAMNGGEFYIKDLGYWVDGYDKLNNIVYEFDEKYHERKKQKEKDLVREQEIIDLLGCKFIRIKEK